MIPLAFAVFLDKPFIVNHWVWDEHKELLFLAIPNAPYPLFARRGDFKGGGGDLLQSGKGESYIPLAFK